MITLGIESSCDETAVAIINSKKEVLAHKLHSQILQHKKFGGVVPELAARSHLEVIDLLIRESCGEAKVNLADIDAFAATAGPGLNGGLLIGTIAAKTLASVFNKPYIAVNHLQAHALMPTFDTDIQFPFLLLLISGGHSQFLLVKGVNNYILLGQTLDDAIGEAFDKTARMMGLSYPGGKEIEQLAKLGDKDKFKFPQPLCNQDNCSFSFSGLKTAVANKIQSFSTLTSQDRNDICASLQHTINKILLNRTQNAIDYCTQNYGMVTDMVISGGVAANKSIRNSLENFLRTKNINAHFPLIKYCTDNGIMIAWAAFLQYEYELTKNPDYKGDSLYTNVLPRWPLESLNTIH